jgi:NAD(P) transhydrogenase subunit beta
MTGELEIGLYIFMLAGFLGYHVITRVPPLLHTPLMSATNAMSGISLVGSLVVAGANFGPLSTLFGFIAVTCSSTNVVGGFLITDRMLQMFRGEGDRGDKARGFQYYMAVLMVLPIVFAGALGVLVWSGQSGSQFRLAAASVEAMRDARVPGSVLTKLRAIQEQDFVTRASFEASLSSLLAGDDLEHHGATILKHAEVGLIGAVRRLQGLNFFYIVSGALFILGLKGLSSPKWARRGMFAAALGMDLAIAGTLFHEHIHGYVWIIVGLTIGTLVGGGMGLWIPMTAVPQRTAFSHALGALAATLIGISEYYRHTGTPELDRVLMTALGFEVLIGGLTFTGSLMAAGKLQELLPGRPITYPFQNLLNFGLLGLLVASLGYLIFSPNTALVFYGMVPLALLFGFLLVVPIGAADMPVVIALLNSYAGLADAAMGFVLMNKIQIITGSLDGTSGFLLSLLMCRAMNRSATNVLFGAFGKVEQDTSAVTATAEGKGTVRSIQADEISVLLESARSVIFVPGYGMAVAQAQHAVAEVAKMLQKRGIDVKYAIHPVAGRMPGHMNVLLAEANVPYDQLYEMEQVNPYFGEADMAIVVGANDVTNPAARSNRSSPLYGMPILEVDRARSIIVLKRSMRPGFAGVDNELYYNPKCMMLFGDAKDSLNKLLLAMKG